MKKILFISFLAIFLCGGAVLAAEKLNTTANSIKANIAAKLNVNSRVKPELNISCAKIAIERRELAVSAAFDKKAAAIKSALSERMTSLKNAWDKKTLAERTKARLEAWKKFKASEAAARSEYKKGVKAVWDRYRQDKKTCYATEENSESEGVDNNL